MRVDAKAPMPTWCPSISTVVVLPVLVLLIARWADERLLVAGLAAGAAIWWWFVLGDSTFVVHWRTLDGLRQVLVPANDDARLAAWTVVAIALVALGSRHEDAGRRERADADDAVADANRDGAVG